MLIKSALVTQISGSIGGMTGAHNKGGMYLRSRAIPTDPQTTRQTEVRDMLSMYSQMWNDTLTAAQRSAWNQFAENVTLLGPLGDPIQVSGQNHFMRANTGRSAANTRLSPTTALASIDDAPTIDQLPMLSPPGIDTMEIGSNISITFDDAADWVNAAQNALLVYMGRPRNAGRNYFKGPYRLVAIVQGDATTPPTSPADLGVAPEDIWPAAADGNWSKLRFALSIGETTDQPTGLSTRTYADQPLGGF